MSCSRLPFCPGTVSHTEGGRDDTGINGTYVPVDYEGMRFLQAKAINFKEHADPNQIIVVCGKKQS